MIFEIHKSEDKSFHFELHLSNGQVIKSEGYKTKHSTIKGIRSLQRNIFCAEIIDLIKNK